ncbi:hypothetical protein GCM10009527_012050 [Actinomadura nitritigenes]|uniref:PPE family domain-containing protein n=1 Tax=Actinomadura nitritigenes TaxID=134602 RepID=A0ABS3QX31_9ACTN|nr:hypothetical protein [Actinomadura nitritigenes]MBO2438544.1 hypothetical protein [Actinomadura nitritigenes]
MTDNMGSVPMRANAPAGSPAGYDLKSIEHYLQSTDPAAVTDAGQAYLRFAKAYERMTQSLAQVGHDLNEAWQGTDASAAQRRMRDLWTSSHMISVTAGDFGTAIERHGSEYLAWYKNSMPQPKTDAEARSWMQGANERISETWTALPPDISTGLSSPYIGHGDPLPTGGSGVPGAPAGASGGSGGAGSGPAAFSPHHGAVGGSNGSGGEVLPSTGTGHSSGAPLTVPSGQEAPGGGPQLGQSPNGSQGPASGVAPGGQGTDLSGASPPGSTGVGDTSPPSLTSPGSAPPMTTPQPFDGGKPGLGFSAGGALPPPGPIGPGLPGRTALGLPGGGYGLPEGGSRAEPGALDRNGVIGRGRLGPPTASQAGAAGEGPLARTGPAAMGPMTGAGGSPHGDRERERKSWLSEDADVWNEDAPVAPRVLGSESIRSQDGTGAKSGRAIRTGRPRRDDE